MKFIKYVLVGFYGVFFLAACENKDYPLGTEDLEHHYYAVFVPNNNTGVTLARSQAALVKFPVQFYSSYTRDYDAIAKYAVVTHGFGITAPAVRGQDFEVVDKNGNMIPATDTTYSITFPQAKQKMDTIYLKMLNSTVPGTRKFELQIMINTTPQFEVDNFSTAYRRPVTIN